MDRTFKILGVALRKYYAQMLARPLNWRIIDALVSLEENEEQPVGKGATSDIAKPGEKMKKVDRPPTSRDDTH
jgi:hypothetical protein